MGNQPGLRLRKVLRYGMLVVGAFFFLFPIWWIFSTSFETSARAYSFPSALIPQFVGSNYIAAWKQGPWALLFLNSAVISFTTMIFAVLTSVLAAFALVYMRPKGSRFFFGLILSTMMVPFEAIIVPEYLLARGMGMINSYAGQIVPFAASGFGIFLLVQFMRALPYELYESARLDGASSWRFLWSIVVPNIRPGLSTTGIYIFLLSWNAFLWPLIITNGTRVQPVQVGLADFLSTANGTDWTALAAASAFVTLPALVLYIFAQRQIIESVSRTGIKG